MKAVNLQALPQHPQLFRANAPRHLLETISTGFPALDEALHGGWPRGTLAEILFSQFGSGEMRLLLPALARLSRQSQWIALVAPPFIPYAPALAAAGIDLKRLLIVKPRSAEEGLWATEQALRSGTCAAVLAFVKTTDATSLRRLQWAAEAGGGLGFIFRSQWQVVQSSPIPVRLRVEPHAQGFSVQVLKRRGGWPLGPLNLCEAEPARLRRSRPLRVPAEAVGK